MYNNPLKYFPWIESIEVARRKICGCHNQKSIFLDFFAVFSGTGHDFEKKTAFSLGS